MSVHFLTDEGQHFLSLLCQTGSTLTELFLHTVWLRVVDGLQGRKSRWFTCWHVCWIPFFRAWLVCLGELTEHRSWGFSGSEAQGQKVGHNKLREVMTADVSLKLNKWGHATQGRTRILKEQCLQVHWSWQMQLLFFFFSLMDFYQLQYRLC